MNLRHEVFDPEAADSMSDAQLDDGVMQLHREQSVPSSRRRPRPTLVTVERSHGCTTFYEHYVKRTFDVLVSLTVLIVLLPLIAAVALLVRVMLGPQIFFYQERVGRGGKTFRMIKFRSMNHDRRSTGEPFDGHDRRRTHKTANDPRHTPTGRFIRKWSLDELPQLFNVLKGDMSLVGPRPELVQVAIAHDLVEHPRHLVRPGITGLWQVSRERSSLLHENVHIDELYVENVTLRGDFMILLRTFGAVLRARGR